MTIGYIRFKHYIIKVSASGVHHPGDMERYIPYKCNRIKPLQFYDLRCYNKLEETKLVDEINGVEYVIGKFMFNPKKPFEIYINYTGAKYSSMYPQDYSGLWKIIDSSGEMIQKMNVKDGIIHGALRIYDEGKLASKYTYKYGEKCGPFEEYHDDKTVIGTYENDQITGECIVKYEDRVKKYLYESNMKNGPYECQDKNGNILVTGQYVNGEKHGIFFDSSDNRYEYYNEGELLCDMKGGIIELVQDTVAKYKYFEIICKEFPEIYCSDKQLFPKATCCTPSCIINENTCLLVFTGGISFLFGTAVGLFSAFV